MFKQIKKLIYYYFHHLKLHKKLLIAFGLVIIIPVFVVYFFSYSKIATLLETNLMYTADQAYEQTYEFSSYKLYKMLRTSDLIFNEPAIHDILTTNVEELSVLEQVDTMLSLQNYLTSFEDREDITRVILYVPDAFIFSDENINFRNINSTPNTPWFNRLNAITGQLFFAPSNYLEDNDPTTLAILRPITNLNNYQTLEGYLRIDFSKRMLTDILNRSNPIDNSYTLLLNQQNELVLSSNESVQSKYPVDYTILQSFTAPTDSYELLSSNGHEFYIQSRLIDNTDWTLMSVIPYKEITASINQQRQTLLIALIIMLLIGFAIAYFISIYITKRLDTLTDHMKNPTKDLAHFATLKTDLDEVGQLALTYEQMHNHIEALMNEKYYDGQALKSAELRALQAQINPHFLYNTLEMINWMAKKNETDKILSVTKELSKFYKLSLSKGEDQVTLRNEVLHLSAYISIQNQRFENHIHYEKNIEPSIAEFIVPKIILQPIAENAIHHGILEKDHQEGQLRVNACLQDNSVIITLEDDGVGMSEKKLSHLFNERAESQTGSHYGLYNIRERLKLFYGNEAGLSVISTVGKGTTITIKLPYSDN